MDSDNRKKDKKVQDGQKEWTETMERQNKEKEWKEIMERQES